ncbi:MAG: AGE family epimerase/isomerase [Lachnospiraceae bacterium]
MSRMCHVYSIGTLLGFQGSGEDEKVLDHENGSWYHQMSLNHQLLNTVWPGKSDLYHALQSMLIPQWNRIFLSQ